VEGVAAAIEGLGQAIAQGLDRTQLQSAMLPGAARNALDCAFWDLEAKRAGEPVHVLAALPAPKPLITAYTISLGTPDAMARGAPRARGRARLRDTPGGADDPARFRAGGRGAPHAELIVDANEGWSDHDLAQNLAACAHAGVTLVEQPLPAG